MSKLHLYLFSNENMGNEKFHDISIQFGIKFKFYKRKYLNLYFTAFQI